MQRFNKLKKQIFNLVCRSILATPPVICCPDSGIVILTQTYHPDLVMCLVALKSFARFIQPDHFVIIDDGLLEIDRQILRQHLTNVRFISAPNVDVGVCPRCGTWERLVTISRLCADHYVIQVDSDTVTVSPPDEVMACLADHRCFTLSTRQGREFIPALEASRFAEQVKSEHVQILAERALATLPDVATKRYIRGCSGFAGFARSAVSVDDLETFSKWIAGVIGMDRWRGWGSEQVTSNFLIANTTNPLALPFERYPYFHPEIPLDEARIIHFIGEHRFHGMDYMRHVRKVIAGIAKKSSAS
ncbi:hypothetical protein [Chromatium okenii]|jgi:hypothetical protein|uniref:hypothetical protein n=1 Tax=Chromatium okenii TaxID=61644 RepID=UPI0026F160FD|nr:hypothetical protein [Chromatium okenii]MBV5309187.1 hypothetical protein [Chromatium okenii]